MNLNLQGLQNLCLWVTVGPAPTMIVEDKIITAHAMMSLLERCGSVAVALATGGEHGRRKGPAL